MGHLNALQIWWICTVEIWHFSLIEFFVRIIKQNSPECVHKGCFGLRFFSFFIALIRVQSLPKRIAHIYNLPNENSQKIRDGLLMHVCLSEMSKNKMDNSHLDVQIWLVEYRAMESTDLLTFCTFSLFTCLQFFVETNTHLIEPCTKQI